MARDEIRKKLEREDGQSIANTDIRIGDNAITRVRDKASENHRSVPRRIVAPEQSPPLFPLPLPPTDVDFSDDLATLPFPLKGTDLQFVVMLHMMSQMQFGGVLLKLLLLLLLLLRVHSLVMVSLRGIQARGTQQIRALPKQRCHLHPR